MKRMPMVLIAAGLCGSCATAPSGSYRVEPGQGVVARGFASVEAPRLRLGPEQSVPSPTGLGQRQPAVAFGDGVYLLVWREGFNGLGGGSDILAMRLAPDGRALDPKPITVAANAGVQDMPAVAFCAGSFAVAWVDRPARGADANARHALRVFQLDAKGHISPAAMTIPTDTTGPLAWPAIAGNGRDQYLLVWQQFAGSHMAVRGTRLDAATCRPVASPNLEVMKPNDDVKMYWALGGPISLAWTGKGYLVSQSVYATFLAPDGTMLLPVTRTWYPYSPGGDGAATAWGKGFLFHCVRPLPDPWGWGGNASIVGMTVGPDGATLERSEIMKRVPAEDKNREFSLLADGQVANCLDAARWLNHPTWPMGMPGELRHTMGGSWPSGPPAAAFNGHSLVVVWPRAHKVDSRRVANRDLYMTRLLPDWAKVDEFPVPVATDPTEESNPALTGGPDGQTLLAYEKLTEAGPAIRWRLIGEQADTTGPTARYVVPLSATEMVIAFDEPVAPADAAVADNFRIEGLVVTKAEFNTDARAKCREVIVTTAAPPVVGREYTLGFAGIRDRSPAANVGRGELKFLAKPGQLQRCGNIYTWDNNNSSERHYRNPDRTGSRDYICNWLLLGPLPRDPANHPFEPAGVMPSPGDRVGQDLRWTAIEGEAVDLGVRLTMKPNHMAYMATYVFSDRQRQAVLRLDSNDHNRAWLNDRLVNDGITPTADKTGPAGERRLHVWTDEVPITLKNGWNRLLVQVENREQYWLMVGQITDANGRLIPDLTWQLTRPEDSAK